MNSSTEISMNTVKHDPSLYNEDLAPVTKERRNWTWFNYTTIWMGMVHSIVTYETTSSLLVVGMNVWQALATVLVANFVIIVAMWLNSTAGAKYGIPFPVLVRAPFGYKGAQIPVIIRAVVAVFWFAVQAYAGSLVVDAVLALIPGWDTLSHYHILGMGLNNAISLALFWLLHVYIVSHGMNKIKFFELWAGPLVIVMGMGLVIWAIVTAGGMGPLFNVPSKLEGVKFWKVFFVSVTGLVSVWSTLVLNVSDLTRFSRSQKDQMIGQAIGLPGTAILFALMSIIITSGSILAFGRPIWNPVELLKEFHNPIILIIGAITLLIATLSVNIAANVVSSAYDLVNLFPKKLNFAKAGIISMFIALFFAPWLWFENASTIFNVFGYIGGALGPVAGIMIADFYLVRKREYDLESFYTKSGAYAYINGWNPRAYIALILGFAASFLGVFIPELATLKDYSWFIGVGVGCISYVLLMSSSAASFPQKDIPLVTGGDEA